MLLQVSNGIHIDLYAQLNTTLLLDKGRKGRKPSCDSKCVAHGKEGGEEPLPCDPEPVMFILPIRMSEGERKYERIFLIKNRW